MNTLEDVKGLILVELNTRYPETDWAITIGKNTNGRDALYIEWYDLPHESGVRAATLRATDILTTRERGFKVNHRHRFSRGIRSAAGAVIRKEIPDFDFLTVDGFIDQDSQYYYRSPEQPVTEVTYQGVREPLKEWKTTLGLVHRVCWLIADAQVNPGSSSS